MQNASTATAIAMVDTNVLVYAYDTREPQKQSVAIALIEKLARESRLAISVQSLNEFYSVVTSPRKLIQMPHERAESIITTLCEVAIVLSLTPEVVARALQGVRRFHLAFWDALIWAVAKDNNVSIVYSEDFNSGATLDGVTFLNPFVGAGEASTPIQP
ncbi:MAG: PIN domain-containing protein [Fimbriimonadales bacterium]|nr:PIN domain-containing protein [Fimbriimonadales bacterium]